MEMVVKGLVGRF